MHESRDAGDERWRKGGCRTGRSRKGGKQTRWVAGQVGFRTGWMNERKDAGSEGSREGGMQDGRDVHRTGGMKERRHIGKEICGIERNKKGGKQEMRDTGNEYLTLNTFIYQRKS